MSRTKRRGIFYGTFHCVAADCRNVVMVGKDTLALQFITKENAGLQYALWKDVKKKGGICVACDCNPVCEEMQDTYRIELPETGCIEATALFFLYCIQRITYEKALLSGVNPDEPDGLAPWIALQS